MPPVLPFHVDTSHGRDDGGPAVDVLLSGTTSAGPASREEAHGFGESTGSSTWMPDRSQGFGGIPFDPPARHAAALICIFTASHTWEPAKGRPCVSFFVFPFLARGRSNNGLLNESADVPQLDVDVPHRNGNVQGLIRRRVRTTTSMNTLGAAVSPELAGLGLDDSGSKQAPSIVLPHQEGTVDGIALDIGGSLVKLAYFTRSPDGGGKLRFEKFETSRIEECLEFIELKRLHRSSVKATGGGAYKYAQLFKERLGIVLEREDELSCMVAGCNFLLKAVCREAFEYSEHGELTFKDIEPSSMFPYLLVNIGSGVRFELTPELT